MKRNALAMLLGCALLCCPPAFADDQELEVLEFGFYDDASTGLASWVNVTADGAGSAEGSVFDDFGDANIYMCMLTDTNLESAGLKAAMSISEQVVESLEEVAKENGRMLRIHDFGIETDPSGDVVEREGTVDYRFAAQVRLFILDMIAYGNAYGDFAKTTLSPKKDMQKWAFKRYLSTWYDVDVDVTDVIVRGAWSKIRGAQDDGTPCTCYMYCLVLGIPKGMFEGFERIVEKHYTLLF